jgi:hypothetical protein
VAQYISAILPSQSDVNSDRNGAVVTGKGRKGKKRTRAYDGDEVFNTTMEVICTTYDDEKALLIACDGKYHILS